MSLRKHLSFSARKRISSGILLCASFFLLAPLCRAQAGASPAAVSGNGGGGGSAAVSVTTIVQPALLDVQRTVGSLATGRWKVPNEVKAETDRNLSSIQRDLVETLPNLLNQADAAGGAVPQAFAVYRNIDALYDVLLRVNETAMLAAPANDASSVETALERLESARKSLGDAIAGSAQDREVQIVKLQAAVKAAAAAPPTPEKTTVVDDGPQAAAAPKKKKKKPATPPANSSGNAAPNSSGSTPQ